jgi:4-carboxymuconolactone decarboxylase
MTLLDPAVRSARGLAIEAEVMGQPARTPATPLEESWRDFVFAEVWNRPGLDRRARFLIAMAGAALGGASSGALDGYVRGALKSDTLSLPELREAALHLAVYAGWSRGGELDRSITRIAEERRLPAATCPPIRAGAWSPAERSEFGGAEFAKVMTFPGAPAASPFLEAIRNFVFGEMWCREGLDQRSRRWITLVGVCESAAEIPIKSHIHAAMASGNCTADEMQEFALAFGVHAGWPKASVVQSVVFEMSRKVEAGLAWNG